MSEMVERVAKAIFAVPIKGRTEVVFGDDARALARAAIEAMRHPTDEMLKAGSETPGNLVLYDSRSEEAKMRFLMQWQAACREAL